MTMHNMARYGAILFMAFFASCSQKFGPQDGAMERSRQNNNLEEQNKKLKAQVAELESEQKVATSGTDASVTLKGLPRPVELSLATGSQVRSGAKPTAAVRFQTLDSHGRFVQVTGPAEVVLAVISEDGEAHRLAKIEFTSEALRSRLRSGFMGMAYSVPVPLLQKAHSWIPAAGGSVLARVTVQDSRISEPLKVEQLIPVLPPRSE